MTLTEPADGSTIIVALIVNRNGGTTGIVSAQWQITRTNGKYGHHSMMYSSKKDNYRFRCCI